MKRTNLFCAFSRSSAAAFEVWLAPQVPGLSRIDMMGAWTADDGQLYYEPSCQYILFGLPEAMLQAIEGWFAAHTDEQTLLWERPEGAWIAQLRLPVALAA